METTKMRCHFSIIFEKTWKVLSVLFIFILSQLGQLSKINLNELQSELKNVFLGLIILIALFLVVILYNFLVWRQTYIWFENNTIIVERNTLNKKVNTYGIKNISNINTEQNLFERLLGTCMIKIDTNSLSSSTSTDIKIVLSQDKAGEFKRLVMSYIKVENIDSPIEEDKELDYDISFSTKEIILHCLYTVSIWSLIVFIGTIIGFILLITYTDNSSFTSIITEIMGGVIACILFFISSITSLVKGFFNYYGFKAKRMEDMLYLSYGLLKRRNYTIPIDKVNAIKIVQPIISRIFHRYQVEVINVGIGDEKNENVQVILSCTKAQLDTYLNTLLPECPIDGLSNITKQRPWYFIHKLPALLIWTMLLCTSFYVGVTYTDFSIWICYTIPLLIYIFILTSYLIAYKTSGLYEGEDCIIVVNGIFKKTSCFVPYEKIQYLELKASPISSLSGLNKANIFILATIVNRSITVPYTKVISLENIGNKIVYNTLQN